MAQFLLDIYQLKMFVIVAGGIFSFKMLHKFGKSIKCLWKGKNTQQQIKQKLMKMEYKDFNSAAVYELFQECYPGIMGNQNKDIKQVKQEEKQQRMILKPADTDNQVKQLIKKPSSQAQEYQKQIDTIMSDYLTNKIKKTIQLSHKNKQIIRLIKQKQKRQDHGELVSDYEQQQDLSTLSTIKLKSAKDKNISIQDSIAYIQLPIKDQEFQLFLPVQDKSKVMQDEQVQEFQILLKRKKSMSLNQEILRVSQMNKMIKQQIKGKGKHKKIVKNKNKNKSSSRIYRRQQEASRRISRLSKLPHKTRSLLKSSPCSCKCNCKKTEQTQNQNTSIQTNTMKSQSEQVQLVQQIPATVDPQLTHLLANRKVVKVVKTIVAYEF